MGGGALSDDEYELGDDQQSEATKETGNEETDYRENQDREMEDAQKAKRDPSGENTQPGTILNVGTQSTGIKEAAVTSLISQSDEPNMHIQVRNSAIAHGHSTQQTKKDTQKESYSGQSSERGNGENLDPEVRIAKLFQALGVVGNRAAQAPVCLGGEDELRDPRS